MPKDRGLLLFAAGQIAAGLLFAWASAKLGTSIVSESSSWRYQCLGIGIGAAVFGVSLIGAWAVSGRVAKVLAGGAGLAAWLFAIFAFHSYTSMYRRSYENRGRGNLNSLRAALGIYQADHDGKLPDSLAELTRDERYLRRIPLAIVPDLHKDASAVKNGRQSDDAGGWLFDVTDSSSPAEGIWVNCTHTDSFGSAWSTY